MSAEPGIAVQTALSKIIRAFPATDAKRIDALLGVMTRTSQHREVALDPDVMLALAEAVDFRHALDLRYVSGQGFSSRRTIHPYGLVAHSDRWYFVAFDTCFEIARRRWFSPRRRGGVPFQCLKIVPLY